MRAQAALDFLMTYGWALALVVIVAGVLFSLGIFDTSNFIGNKAAGFSGVAVKGWSLDSHGNLTLMLTNQATQRVRVNRIEGVIRSDTQGNNFSSIIPASSNSGLLSVTGFGAQQPSSGYNAKVLISYTDLATGFNHTSSGTLTGKVV
ncbi:MAG: hypothetical protein NT051_01895 [Candidatus Micrarchaeota archaeon]|nr:hypothetical protein [Candidatus Micrarchaeota archaeon]